MYLQIILSLVLVMCSSQINAQEEDSVVLLQDSVTPVLDIQMAINQSIYFQMDCAHGHICCQALCSCCPELSRPQRYTKRKEESSNGITRYRIDETHRLASEHGLAPIKYVFEDSNGKVIHEYFTTMLNFYGSDWNSYNWQYPDSLDEFKDGYALVFDENYDHVLINREGTPININYHSRISLTESVDKVSIMANGREIFGLVDKRGNKLGKLKYVQIGAFDANGLAISKSIQHGYSGGMSLLDEKGNEVIDEEYAWISRVSDELFSMGSYKGLHLVDREEKFVSKNTFESIGVASEGLIAVKKEGKMGYIDLVGRIKVKCEYDYCSPFSSGRGMVTKERRTGYVNKRGKLVIPMDFNRGTNFENGAATVQEGFNYRGKWGMIDTVGNFIVEPSYYELDQFKNGISKGTIRNEGEVFLNLNGKPVWSKKFHLISNESIESYFQFDRAVLQYAGDDDKYTIINAKGKKIKEISVYDYVRFPSIDAKENVYAPYFDFSTDMKHGLMDLNGKEVLSKRFKGFRFISEHTLIALTEKSALFIDLEKGIERFIVKGNIVSILPTGTVRVKVDENIDEYYRIDGTKIDGLKPASL